MRRFVWLLAAFLALPVTAVSGPYFYSTHGAEPAELIRFDLTTGAWEDVGALGWTFEYPIIGLAFTSDGSLYGVDWFADRLVQIDPRTGAGTLVGSFGVDVGWFADLAGGLDGVLWLLDDSSARLYRVDRATAAPSPSTARQTRRGRRGAWSTETASSTRVRGRPA